MKKNVFLKTMLALLLAAVCCSCKHEVESVEVRPENIEMIVGEERPLTVFIKPDKAPKTVQWSSSNLNVATVSASGLVSALAEGECEITAYADAHKAVCKVKVSLKGKPNEGDTNTIEDTSVYVFEVNGVSFKMLSVKAGTFSMGAYAQDILADAKERPCHDVSLSAFYLGEMEVTQALWNQVMKSNPSRFKGDYLPVQEVSWEDCQLFIQNLNTLLAGKLGDKKFALPTEAQWEYAARAGSKTSLYNNEDMNVKGYNNSPNLDKYAWYGGNCGQQYSVAYGCDERNGENISRWAQKQYADSIGGVHVVGQKQPNAWGFYDMLGNVAEWCSDWFGNYDGEADVDPQGPESGTKKVLRGGAWSYWAKSCRVSSREEAVETYTYYSTGLRLMMCVAK